MNTPMIELPDGSGFFTATILSNDEAMVLPLKERPLNYRISGDMYHAVFEAIGEASTTWKTEMGNEVFNSTAAEKIAVDLCFKIANEVENSLAQKRLDALLELLDGSKWEDVAALAWYKPDAEKYTTKQSTVAAIDAAITDKKQEV